MHGQLAGKRFLLGLIALVSVAMFAAACGSDDATAAPTATVPGPTATPETETVTIGATVPLSGSLAVWGDLVRESMSCAIEHINEDGTIPYVNLALKVEDSKGDAAEGLSAMRKLVTVDDVPVVFTIFTNIALAQAPVADDLEVVLWSSGVQHPEFGTMSPWTFRNAANAQHTADAIYRYLREDKGEGDLKWGIIYNAANDATQVIRDRVKKVVESLGGEVVAEEGYVPEDRDFRTQLTKIKAADADVLWLSTVGTETGLMLAQAPEVGYEPKYLVGGIGENGEVLETAGADAEGYTWSAPSFNAASTDPAVQRFAECYSAARDVQPDGFAAAFYDGVQALARGMVAASDPTNAASIKAGVETLASIDGVGGNYAFDPVSGDAWQELGIRGVVNQAYADITTGMAPYPEIE